jgi:alkylation response protein AidB-like acyl-CoA dehydrogenase
MRHDISYNIPTVEWKNLLEEDPAGQKLWSYYLTPATYQKVRGHFMRMGEAGAQATPYSAIADVKSPELVSYNSLGERISEVNYDPSYLKLQQLAYGQGIVSIKFDPVFLKEHQAHRHLVGFAAGYYFAQTETGLYCPICMTDALARVLERNGQKHPMARKALERLGASEDYWQGAMFLTERQGGSDVGANEVQAREEQGRWFLNGHKWFCSNVDAQAILALARMPGAEGALDQGTRGLGLFLILRETPENNFKTIEIQRLKKKLGVRSMASGEVILNNTEAFLIAGAGSGFKVMADMVNMSRLYNAVSSVAVARRAILEALAFGSRRQAFGAELAKLPLWRAAMADLVAEHWGLLHLVFEAAQQLDAGDQGDVNAQKLSRVLTPLAKSLSARFAVFAASECMEAIGGIAYIEENILPRLLRDAQVLPIWEGTTNIQSLDMLRVMAKEGLDVFWARLTRAGGDDATFTARVKQLQSTCAQFAQLAPADQQRGSRQLSEQMGRVLIEGLLLESSRSTEVAEISRAALARVRLRSGFTQAPASTPQPTLVTSEEVLMRAGFRGF